VNGAGARQAVHVRLLTWDDDPPHGGQGVFVRELRTALERRGVVVSTIAGRGASAVAYRRVLGHEALDMSLWANTHRDRLLEGRPDVIQISGGPGGLLVLRRLGIPVVYAAYHTYRQAHAWPSARRALGVVEARAYRRAWRVAAISASTAEAVRAMGVDSSRLVVIPPGVRPLSAGGAVRREPGRMLFVGRLEADKGPVDAVEAMARVADCVPGAVGYVAGDGSLAGELRHRAAASGGRVRFLGAVSDEELARQYGRAEVVVLASRYEGLNLVALEARAAGAVVVGYDVTGLRDSIGPYGVLVPAGDVAGLAAACGRLFAHRGLLAEMAAASLEAVRRDHSWDRCAESFEVLYRQAGAGRGRA
jgi:glycosyltransferase involved in cell wall biosynthesis